MTAYLSGFGLGLGLILAIGAQNAFVLRQGLTGRHVAAVVLVCILSDAVLIALGVAGFGVATALVPGLEAALRWIGAAFLFAYGALRLRAAWRGGESLQAAATDVQSLRSALGLCLALTWLNPHVWLDTVVLVGGVAQQHPGAEWAFAAGATSASALFFPVLGWGAALLRPLFARPVTWRLLDLSMCLLMWVLAVSLILD